MQPNHAQCAVNWITILHPALRRKRPELIDCTPLILQDNSSRHTSPPYSSDLSPHDFDLFPELKEPQRRIRPREITLSDYKQVSCLFNLYKKL